MYLKNNSKYYVEFPLQNVPVFPKNQTLSRSGMCAYILQNSIFILNRYILFTNAAFTIFLIFIFQIKLFPYLDHTLLF